MRLLLKLPLALTATLMIACSTQTYQPTTAVVNWEQHVRQLQQLDTWLLNGKLGYRDSREGGSAWVNWAQQQDTFELKLNGPFGAGATYISGHKSHAELQRAGHEKITAVSPGALTKELFGWQWPIEQLQFWVRGIPSPGTQSDSLSHNPDGTLAQLYQSNWQLQFSGYQQVDGWLLPNKIKGQHGDYKFTLVIKNWQPGDQAR